MNVNAIIDTGADATIVPVRYLRQIAARRSFEATIRSQWGERRRVYLYLVDLQLETLTLPGIYVVGDDQGDEVVLGRDVLNRLRVLLDGLDLLLIALAAVAAGAVNAIAGGGTLISFPALIFVGIPPVAASITNTVALTPGYLGATLAQARDLVGQRRRLWLLVPTGAIGGVVGGLLLVNTSEKLFEALVPFLILLASALLGFQNRLRSWVVARAQRAGHATLPEFWVVFPVFLAAIYGGYFGAGLSVIVLAVLALVVVWPAALVMAVGALLGGVIGGRLASRIQPETLRRVVVTIGVVVSIIYLVR